MTARDGLVLAVVALVALVLIEGMLLATASPIGATITATTTSTVVASIPVVSTSTVTITSNSTSTVTPSVTTQTDTLTSTATSTATATSIATNSVTQTSTSTITLTITSNATSTQTSTATTTTTTTTTATTTITTPDTGPFVIIQPDASTNKTSNGFSPAKLLVIIGVNNTVTWINDDSAHQTVTSTSSAEPFNSGDLSQGQSYSFTFTKPGTYNFTSVYYGWMNGIITVEAGQ